MMIIEKIIDNAIFTKRLLESERPTRMVVSTNLFVPLKMNGKFFLRLYNMEPKSWNVWYPFYYTTEGVFLSKATTYGELFNDFLKELEKLDNACKRKRNLINKFSDCHGVLSAQIEILNCLFPGKYLIKYSQTKKEWSMYFIEFYILTKIGYNSLLKPNNLEYCDIVLEEKTINNIQLSGNYLEKKIVDNVVEILLDQKALSEIKANAIDIGVL